MSSFDNHQHIEEVTADMTDEERQELDAWIHGFWSDPVGEEIDPSGGCEIDESDFEDGQPTEYQEYQDLYGGDDWDHGQFNECF